MDIKIIVAAHKAYQMPQDDMYLPLHVGKEGKEDIGFAGDNSGEHISERNPYFCELTGLYWAWKNLDADYVGLAHYRRHFAAKGRVPKAEAKKFSAILSRAEAEEHLKACDVVLPRLRKYYIENLYNHYKHTMYVEPLDEAGKIIAERYPDYLPEFEALHKRTSAHMFNMFIMKRDVLDRYCTWLFDILFELEKRVDPTQYEAFHARYPGRISELLLDVWLRTNKVEYAEVPVMEMQHINKFKKGMSFLRAKFTGKKYGESF